MSVRSMTGFGVGSARGAGMRVAAEIGSVNRKALDIRLNLPPLMRPFEAEIQKMVAERIARGAVSCSIGIEWTRQARAQAVQVDEQLAGAYIGAIRSAAKRLDLQPELPAEILLKLPDVVRQQTPEVDEDQLRAAIARALSTALKRLDAMRRREGAVLAKDVSARIDALERMARAIRKREKSAGDTHRRRLKKLLQEAGAAADDERMLREVVFYADKADISEELTRLESHFAQARGFIKSGEPAGRPLEFLSQELLREINTVASKSPDAAIAQTAIEFKSELERLREQIRNIE